jgi:hypothetical protein
LRNREIFAEWLKKSYPPILVKMLANQAIGGVWIATALDSVTTITYINLTSPYRELQTDLKNPVKSDGHRPAGQIKRSG